MVAAVEATEPLEAPPLPSSEATALTGTRLRSLEVAMTAVVLRDLTVPFRGRALMLAGERADGNWTGLKGRVCGVRERRERRW